MAFESEVDLGSDISFLISLGLGTGETVKCRQVEVAIQFLEMNPYNIEKAYLEGGKKYPHK
jgi:hypothetical protein